jgi:GNAT superfamily N-acetyltransferase
MIHDATTDDDILATFDVMIELRPHLKREDYVAQVRLQMQDGYELTFARVNEVVEAVAGWRFSRNLAWGRFLYIDDLVTRSAGRSHGHGHALIEHLVQVATQAGCASVELDSGTQRLGAHRFYLRERFDISSFHFRRRV